MGIFALPAPRITAETAWAKASRQKKRDSVLIWLTPIATTAGSSLKSGITQGQMSQRIVPRTSAEATAARIPKREPLSALS